MKVWKKNLAPALWALAGVLSLVPVMKDIIQGESVRTVFLAIAIMFFIFAVVFFAAGRKSGGGPGPPTA